MQLLQFMSESAAFCASSWVNLRPSQVLLFSSSFQTSKHRTIFLLIVFFSFCFFGGGLCSTTGVFVYVIKLQLR